MDDECDGALVSDVWDWDSIVSGVVHFVRNNI